MKDDTQTTEQTRADHTLSKAQETPPPAAQDPRQVAARSCKPASFPSSRGRDLYAPRRMATFGAAAPAPTHPDEFVGNLRLHFIYHPGSDIFLVLNEGRGREGDPWLLRDRGLVFKITYLKRI